MKNFKIIPLLFLFLAGIFVACNKDEDMNDPSFSITNISEIDPFIQSRMDSTGMIGLQAAIVKNDQILWSKGYGFANKAENRLETPQTVHMIASVTKTVTAVAIMQLAEAGKINLDGNINDYLPFKVENPNFPNEKITPRHLLTHTSSITDDYFYDILLPKIDIFYGRGIDVELSLRDFCAGFLLPNGQFYNLKTFTKKKPGAEFSYSNVGVSLLGLMAEHVSGKPYHQYAKEKIFQPLGMSNTSFRLADFQANQLSEMYKADGTPWGNYTISPYPAGGLRSNVQDMSKYVSAIMLGGTLNGTKILSQASINEMLREQKKDTFSGLLWYEFPIMEGFSVWGHDGGGEGMYTVLFFNKATKVGAMVFTNTDFKRDEDFEVLYEIMANLIHVGEQE